MAVDSLSANDINVLEKIKDPESDPTQRVVISHDVPRDPHVTENSVYDALVRRERHIIGNLQQAEMIQGHGDLAYEYHRGVKELGRIILEYPQYASARNNRVQALRRLYGDGLLVADFSDPSALVPTSDAEQRRHAVTTALDDLKTSIHLLTPSVSTRPLSPQSSRTLAAVHTQRAAIYHKTARLIGQGRKLDGDVCAGLDEAEWSRVGFEEKASIDFASGGRYGNDIAKGLAVSVNPTAKLCGEIVREARRKEYGETYAM